MIEEQAEKNQRSVLVISDEEFTNFSSYMYKKIGVVFTESKRYFVDKRVEQRVIATNCATFSEYFSLLRLDSSGREMQEMVNLLTVNETYFLRENYQFDTLVKYILPEIAARKTKGDRIRIWSLPCSTGEEPYSIAISILEQWKDTDDFYLEIFASDIDTAVLEKCRKGIYGERSLQHISRDLRKKYFEKLPDGQYQIIRSLRESIEFSRVNIHEMSDMVKIKSIDVVFCRNLLIYFDDISRREAIAKIYDAMADQGFILLGHSESMSRISSAFTSRRLGESMVYQRPAEGR